jgi:hypothetical protein
MWEHSTSKESRVRLWLSLMNGKWSGNSFLLSSRSLANHAG